MLPVPDLEAALSRVGTTEARLREVGGSVLAEGRAYLVGSLAQGFGNRGSDVDIHVFTESARPDAAPYLFFVGRTPVDVECFPEDRVPATIAEIDCATAPAPCGRIALAAPPRGHRKLCLTRWLSALPLDDAHGPLLDDAQAALVRAHLLRHSVDLAVLHAALAVTAALGGADPHDLWRRSARALLDLRCTARGFPPIGSKWLPARLRAAGIDPAEFPVPTDLPRWAEAAADLMWPVDDPLALVRLEDAAQGEPVPLGSKTMRLTRYNRLRDDERTLRCDLRQAVEDAGARQVLAWMTGGVVRPVVDSAALDACAPAAVGRRELAGRTP